MNNEKKCFSLEEITLAVRKHLYQAWTVDSLSQAVYDALPSKGTDCKHESGIYLKESNRKWCVECGALGYEGKYEIPFNGVHKCEYDNVNYATIPKCYRCKNCKHFWFDGDPVPECKAKGMTQPRPLTDKELAKIQYDATVCDESKGMVEKENICIHYVPISQCPVCAPKEGSSADREQFSKELFNSLGGCIIKETTGETIWDRWIAKLSAKPELMPLDEEKLKECFKEYFHPITHHSFIKEVCKRFGSPKPSVPSVEDLINTIKPFLFGYSQGENPTSKIAQAIHRMLSKEMK